MIRISLIEEEGFGVRIPAVGAFVGAHVGAAVGIRVGSSVGWNS
jgi:uncharacterized membrane protein